MHLHFTNVKKKTIFKIATGFIKQYNHNYKTKRKYLTQ